MMSRVVPACGETIATSRRASWLISVDLPTLGGPAIATTSPSRKAFALALCRKHLFDLGQQRPRLRKRRRDQFRRHIALVGKIDAGLDQRGSLDDLRAPVARSVAEHALQLTQRLAALPVSVGMDEIVEAFGFGEIELAVFKRAAGEFAGLGRPHIFKTRQRREQGSQHGASAMDVKLGDVFAGRAGRSGKPEHHRVIDRPLADIVEQRPGRHSGHRHFSGERRQRRAGLGARYPHDSDRARRPARRQGEDGLIPWMHRLFVREALEKAKAISIGRPAGFLLQQIRSIHAATNERNQPRRRAVEINVLYSQLLKWLTIG